MSEEPTTMAEITGSPELEILPGNDIFMVLPDVYLASLLSGAFFFFFVFAVCHH